MVLLHVSGVEVFFPNRIAVGGGIGGFYAQIEESASPGEYLTFSESCFQRRTQDSTQTLFMYVHTLYQ